MRSALILACILAIVAYVACMTWKRAEPNQDQPQQDLNRYRENPQPHGILKQPGSPSRNLNVGWGDDVQNIQKPTRAERLSRREERQELKDRNPKQYKKNQQQGGGGQKNANMSQCLTTCIQKNQGRENVGAFCKIHCKKVNMSMTDVNKMIGIY
jgi:hypothetical protein